ncbi:uracil-DNA glycosylase [Saprolegnia diclina VS20]|uniref:Uracil-DNA glycosylase n=1 Tax=Saprolegnia diclina (strain VS20) TaxID=1156394 RepID=T0QHR0_SAPDV|nr:uracil-DNA glycosylase [Saprolegnia diclina VS20]EQC33240.1 uracil-DNA glycosylase [Saprolegnia diclina VS20]|eukprot:XP_008613363.1 uracil-DNA glycosylase [Saprolegnia diclina VS20]
MSDIRAFFTASDRPKRAAASRSSAEPAAKKAKETPAATEAAPAEAAPTKTASAAPAPATVGDLLTEPTWREMLAPEFKKSYFKSLDAFLVREQQKKAMIFPPKSEIFTALNLCPFDKIKVVILGQDPYHGPGQAHGLCFSVQKPVPPPPSLKNIYKEAIADVNIPKPSHGCLLSWCDQGVLLLNTVLTVRATEANSHKKQGWETFTDVIMRKISKETSGVVFLLWGKPAQEKSALIDRSKHCILTSSHPSPLGATKTAEPFIGSRCFSKTNAYLVQQGKDPIDWTVE